MARRVVGVLKSFRWFEMRAYVEDCLFVKSFALEDSCVEKVDFFVGDFSHKFNCGAMLIS